MAQLAGFELEPRRGDWAGAEFHRRIPLPRFGLPASGVVTPRPSAPIDRYRPLASPAAAHVPSVPEPPGGRTEAEQQEAPAAITAPESCFLPVPS
jgi:hypothetical protein